MTSDCELCMGDGGEVLFRDARLRVVAVGGEEGEMFEGFCRVVWNEHVRELTDLCDSDREHLMSLVFALETALRTALDPLKMNLASLGNLTPHVHWHLIPRTADDVAFPKPIWALTLNPDALANVKSRTNSDAPRTPKPWKDAVRHSLSTFKD